MFYRFVFNVSRMTKVEFFVIQVELYTDLENKLPEMLIRNVNKTELLVYPNSKLGPRFLHRILSAFNFACPMNDSRMGK